ncbi:MAG: hypothetical protein U1E53_09525 [Dongiaceae bacterium]
MSFALAAGAAPIAVFAAGFVWVLGRLTAPGCEVTERASIPSPDGRHRAVVFSRDCGATTGFSTQLALLGAADRLSIGSDAALVVDGRHELDVRWTADRSVAVAVPKGDRVYRRAASQSDVTILYRDAD